MRKALLIFCGCFLLSSNVFADQTADLKKYIDFVVQWTSYKYNNEPLPKIKKEKHGLVQVIAYGDFEYAQAEAKGVELPTVLAIYDAKYKTIYVSDQVQDNDPFLSVTMVHEMVHYLQDISGYTASLNGRLSCTESEAYDVQMLWQIENNIRKDEIPYTQQRSLISAMRCMGSKSEAFPRLKSRYSED